MLECRNFLWRKEDLIHIERENGLDRARRMVGEHRNHRCRPHPDSSVELVAFESLENRPSGFLAQKIEIHNRDLSIRVDNLTQGNLWIIWNLAPVTGSLESLYNVRSEPYVTN